MSFYKKRAAAAAVCLLLLLLAGCSPPNNDLAGSRADMAASSGLEAFTLESLLDKENLSETDIETIRENFESGRTLKQMQDDAGDIPVASINGESILASELAVEKWRYQSLGEEMPEDAAIIHGIALEKLKMREAKRSGYTVSESKKQQLEHTILSNYTRNAKENEAFAAGRGLAVEEAIQEDLQNEIDSEILSLWQRQVMEELVMGELTVPTDEFSEAYEELQSYQATVESGIPPVGDTAEDAMHAYLTSASEKVGALYDLYLEYLLEQSSFQIF